MTDKRFTTDNGSNEDVCLVDNVTGNEYESNFEDIVELLNELHEENQDLECKLAEKHQDLTELGLKYGDIIDIKIANEVIDNQRNTIKELSDENEQLKQQLNYIQNSITEHIKHQKTGLGQKALKEIIADYNEWMLGHKELEE